MLRNTLGGKRYLLLCNTLGGKCYLPSSTHKPSMWRVSLCLTGQEDDGVMIRFGVNDFLLHHMRFFCEFVHLILTIMGFKFSVLTPDLVPIRCECRDACAQGLSYTRQNTGIHLWIRSADFKSAQHNNAFNTDRITNTTLYNCTVAPQGDQAGW